MLHDALIKELTAFYQHGIDERAEAFRQKLFSRLDEKCTPEMNGYQRKALQYREIAEACEPVLFDHSPFYHELGTMAAICDGAGEFRGHYHAGGWNWARSQHLFRDQDPALYEVKSKQAENLLYLICGPFADTRQHFMFNCLPVYKGGLRLLYEQAQQQLTAAQTQEERDFLEAACEGLLCMKMIEEKFARAAEEKLRTATDEQQRRRLERIRDAAMHTPWNAPRTFYEGLNMLAFCRTVCGTLELAPGTCTFIVL